ncbi:hypothetical protein [Sutcliffiella rhizosphaerae]|uniref:Uncharacterized protein n=1 Tax=Sutcliffiella rhizosphaerae TaxID=2880967 RepID=A0ABM8YK64_9BACI|nr:hypothetical protein [Sutcliffiella rhizosphaerae]CAG9620178.1 hypothetical protein BACCIP111883_00946 [Sutcliffiella rhizosphaerae]
MICMLKEFWQQPELIEWSKEKYLYVTIVKQALTLCQERVIGKVAEAY